MFTGIIKYSGKVQDISHRDGGDWRILIQTDLDLSAIEIGASIACSGCCLTVVEKKGDVFAVDVSHETLSKTNIGKWQVGGRINIEPSLKIGDEMGGHIVTGHVDGLAILRSVKKEGDSRRLVFDAPHDLIRMIAPKGSVTLDGVSLTVNGADAGQFGVNIIPHTWTHTTLGTLGEGEKVHLEVDILARYVARALLAQ